MNIKNINIFDFTDYKKFLLAVIKNNPTYRGLFKQLAEAANCQASYVSQVLRKGAKTQLTPDHALGISKFLLLSTKERDYFLLLVDYERAVSLDLQNLLKEKILTLQKSSSELGEVLYRPKMEDHESLSKFYSLWAYSYVHILTSIPAFQNTSDIAKKIHFSEQVTLQILSDLESMGLVLRQNGLWKHSGKQLHIDSKSNFVINNHQNWRQQSLLNAQLGDPVNSVHFTGIYSVAKQDFHGIKAVVLDCLKSVNSTALASNTEEVLVFCCDLFLK